MLAGAASLVPVEQARIHTLTSLDKHVDFGAWFAAIAAGYAASKLIDLWRRRWLRAAATVVIGAALVVPAQRGAAQGLSLVRQWPNATRFYHAFGQLAAVHPGRFLVETPSIPEYYLPLGAHWQLWSNTRSVVLPSGHSISAAVNRPGNPSVYARFIGRDYFSLVALDFYATRVLDHEIAADLNRNPRYRVVADVPYGNGRYTFWARIPAASRARVAVHPPHPARSSRAVHSRLSRCATLAPLRTLAPRCVLRSRCASRAWRAYSGPRVSREARESGEFLRSRGPPSPVVPGRARASRRHREGLVRRPVAAVPDHRADDQPGVRDAGPGALRGAQPGGRLAVRLLHADVFRLSGRQPAHQLRGPQLRPRRARVPGGGVAARVIPVGGHLPAYLRGAARGPAQHLDRRVRAAQRVPRDGPGVRAG